MATPAPNSMMPVSKNVDLHISELNSMGSNTSSNQKSIPIPVIKAVINAGKSGLVRNRTALIPTRIMPLMISQVPGVNPTALVKPTFHESKGMVPRFDLMVKLIPKVKMKIPIT